MQSVGPERRKHAETQGTGEKKRQQHIRLTGTFTRDFRALNSPKQDVFQQLLQRSEIVVGRDEPNVGRGFCIWSYVVLKFY